MAMGAGVESGKRAWVVVEVLVVVAVIAVALGLSYTVYRGARHAARVAKAQSNLNQLGVAFELYYRQKLHFPPAGSDLTQELAPFIKNPAVFANPLMEEGRPGQTVNGYYRQPDRSQVDEPNHYITAFVSDDGSTAVRLKTGGIVDKLEGLRLPVDDVAQASAQLATDYWRYESPPPSPPPAEPPATPPAAPPVVTGGFDVDSDGSTVTKAPSNVTLKNLGAQFGYADGTLVQMVLSIKIGDGAWTTLFGGQPISGGGGESFTQPSVAAGTKVLIKAEVYDSYSRNLLTRYGWPLSYTSNDQTGQVVTLRDGDLPICNKPGFPYQVGVGDILAPFADPATGKITLPPDKCIYCFDFNPLRTATGIDFNDVCVLGTATLVEGGE